MDPFASKTIFYYFSWLLEMPPCVLNVFSETWSKKTKRTKNKFKNLFQVVIPIMFQVVSFDVKDLHMHICCWQL
jgi:hypothetical protein